MRSTGPAASRARALSRRRSLGMVALAGGLALAAQAPVRAATLATPGTVLSAPPAHPAGRWLLHVPAGPHNVVASLAVDSLSGRLGFAADQEMLTTDGSDPSNDLIVGELSSASGATQWEVTIPDSSGAATIAPGGDLVVTGVFVRPSSFDGMSGFTNSCFVGRYQAVSHSLEWGYLLPPGSTCAPSSVDGLGDVYVGGDYTGPATVYGQQASGTGVYLARLNGLTGQPVWTRLIPNNGADVDHLSSPGIGNLFVSGTYDYLGEGITFGPGAELTPPPRTGTTYVPYAWLASFNPIDGSAVWAHQLKVGGLDANAGGKVDSLAATSGGVAVSLECGGCDLGGGVVGSAQGLYGGLLAGYDGQKGGYLWSEAGSSPWIGATPLLLAADPDGNVDFAGSGYPSIVLDKPDDNYSGTSITATPDPGGSEITGTISPATGGITNVISTGGDVSGYNPPSTTERALTADSSGHLYTAGGFSDATWQYGLYLPGDTSTTTTDPDGFASG